MRDLESKVALVTGDYRHCQSRHTGLLNKSFGGSERCIRCGPIGTPEEVAGLIAFLSSLKVPSALVPTSWWTAACSPASRFAKEVQ
jgi:NAD(P)-dependent dehydrogenase (short-subunit alcohol dehydrogenase family)